MVTLSYGTQRGIAKRTEIKLVSLMQLYLHIFQDTLMHPKTLQPRSKLQWLRINVQMKQPTFWQKVYRMTSYDAVFFCVLRFLYFNGVICMVCVSCGGHLTSNSIQWTIIIRILGRHRVSEWFDLIRKKCSALKIYFKIQPHTVCRRSRNL